MSAPATPRYPLRDPFYSQLKEHVIASTGLAYYADRDADLAAVIDRRLEERGFETCASYLGLLLDEQAGHSERDALISQLTVGETYFFRHQEQFDALRDSVLPEIIAKNESSRHLRIWSAGCAIGAEPYSIAILLRRELAHRLDGWKISILGTDINREFLKQARHGAFAEWALRSTAEHLKDSCFSRTGNVWEIAPEYKDGVSFEYHNLATDPFPGERDEESGFDLIVCRNVTIYFDTEVTNKIVERFYHSLNPGGWLLVGHTEPNAETFRAFRSVSADGATLYQKSQDTGLRPAPPETSFVSPVWPFIAPAGPRHVSASNHRAPPAKDRPVQKAQLSEADLAGMRRLADQGEWESAAARCRELLHRDRLHPVVYFYHALILDQVGAHEAAKQSYRQAIYLDRKFALAHYYLGLALRDENDPQAARCFGNVLKLLSRMPAEQEVFEGGGTTAGSLKELTQMQREELRRS
jgi:chemotaxis protein methyltransferase CheR